MARANNKKKKDWLILDDFIKSNLDDIFWSRAKLSATYVVNDENDNEGSFSCTRALGVVQSGSV